MPKIALRGKVFSGTGKGKKFMNLPWVKRQIERKLGFFPYSGTLNIRLNKESVKKKTLFENVKEIEIDPQAGYFPGLLFKAYLDTLNCAVVIPKVPNYPSDVLEIVAPIYLREHLKLVDGSLVIITINV